MSELRVFDFEKRVTPPRIFAVMRERYGRPTAMVESLQFDEENKFSLIASDPVQIVSSNLKSFEKLKTALNNCQELSHKFRFKGGLIGAFNFEIFDEIESGVYTHENPDSDHAEFYEFSRFVFFDHDSEKIIFYNVSNPDFIMSEARALVRREVEVDMDIPVDFSMFQSENDFASFETKVQTAKQKILDGEVFQMIVSNGFSVETQKDVLDFYEVLRVLEPQTHNFLLDFPTRSVAGASIEILGSKVDDEVLYRPIAGTRLRGDSPEADRIIFEKLRKNEKENAEHDMLLDLGRNDLGRVCLPGSVEVSREKYGKLFAHVMHLVSDLKGKLRPEFDAVEFFHAIFPAGTLTGAPKIRAIELISRLETQPRGIYGGAVGYFSTNGDMELCIAIRSFEIRDGVARFRTGAGVVADSNPEDEWLEVHNKAKSLARMFQVVGA